MGDKKIFILSTENQDSTRWIFNSLKQNFNIESVVLEKRIEYKDVFKRRLKKLGFLNVFGQYLFFKQILPKLRISSRNRIKEVVSNYTLDYSKIATEKIIHVDYINSDEFIHLLQKKRPDLIVVDGTRIIEEKILNVLPINFINMHNGITPLYRGSFGAYWALVNNDKEHCGTTIHLIDKDIDTGSILAQSIIVPTQSDNFYTYLYLHYAIGIPLLKKAVKDVLDNNYKIILPPNGLSKIWYHPTIWEYKRNLKKGIK